MLDTTLLITVVSLLLFKLIITYKIAVAVMAVFLTVTDLLGVATVDGGSAARVLSVDRGSTASAGSSQDYFLSPVCGDRDVTSTTRIVPSC